MTPKRQALQRDQLAVLRAIRFRERHERLGRVLGRLDLVALLEREGGEAQRRAHRTRVDKIDAQVRLRDFLGIRFHQRLERRFAGGVGRPIGLGLARGDAGREDRAAGGRGAQQRIERADEAPIRGDIHIDDLLPMHRIEMPGRREMAERGGAGDEDIERAEALLERGRHRVEPVELPKVERHQGRVVAVGAEFVVELFERGFVARQQHEPRPLGGEAVGKRGAQAARCAGDQGEAIFEASAWLHRSARNSFGLERWSRGFVVIDDRKGSGLRLVLHASSSEELWEITGAGSGASPLPNLPPQGGRGRLS